MDRYLKDFLRELNALSGRYPAEATVIASHGVVAALDDDEAFEVLLRLVGPQAPAFADESWQLISAFLSSRRAEELFGGPEGAGQTHVDAVRRPRYLPPSTRPVIQQCSGFCQPRSLIRAGTEPHSPPIRMRIH